MLAQSLKQITHVFYLAIITGLALALGSQVQTSAAPNTQSEAVPAVTPPYMSYQGFVRDPEGDLLTGTYTLTFRIYNDLTQTVDESLWVEEHRDITVRDGYFTVLLGNTTPLATTVFSGTDTFIGVTLEGYDEMVPRQRFSTVPYAAVASEAFHATEADRADRADLADRINGVSIHPDARADALRIDDHGEIGIGLENPATALHIKDVFDPWMIVEDGPRKLEVGVLGRDAIMALVANGGDLHVDSRDHDLLLQPGRSGNMGIFTNNPENRDGGWHPTLDIHGHLEFFGDPPIIIKRFENVGGAETGNSDNIPTGIPSHYNCTAAGWHTRHDIYEQDQRTRGVWTYLRDGQWYLFSDFGSDASNRDYPDVDVLCFKIDFSVWQGAPRELFEAN